jgi:ADP-ribose pyrophosphatase YjhB (NUDIX family)
MSHVPHFEEPGRINRDRRVPENFWMSPDTYAQVLDTVVITCVDVLFVHGHQVLLGKRNRHPCYGWWVIGGRMLAGESPLVAVQRKVKEETRLEIGRSRIQFFGVYSTAFATRHQSPIDNGLHSVNLAHFITISDEEKRQISLTRAEYDAWVWVTQQTLSTLLTGDRPIDSILHQIITDCWAARQP